MLTLISNHWLSGLFSSSFQKNIFSPKARLKPRRLERIFVLNFGLPKVRKDLRTTSWWFFTNPNVKLERMKPQGWGNKQHIYELPPPRLILLRGRIFGKLANNQPSKWDHLLHIYFHLPTFSFQVSLFVRKVFLFEAKLCGFIWEIPPSRVVLEICLSSILDMEGANQKLE